MSETSPPRRKKTQSQGLARTEDAYVLKLYITGTTPSSSRALVNTRAFCEEFLRGRYDLEVIDISADPRSAKEDQVLAAPTLIKKLPAPLRRFIGDMSNRDRLMVGLELL